MRLMLPLFAAAILSACVVVPVPVGVVVPGEGASRSNSTPVASTASFTAMLNGFRADEGRGPVQQSAALTRAAEAHAADMVARGYFSHRSENGPNGETFVQRSRAAGCGMRAGAENIATGQRTEAEVLTAWANSAGHRRNMLGASYTEYGIGRVGDIWVLKLATSC